MERRLALGFLRGRGWSHGSHKDRGLCAANLQPAPKVGAPRLSRPDVGTQGSGGGRLKSYERSNVKKRRVRPVIPHAEKQHGGRRSRAGVAVRTLHATWLPRGSLPSGLGVPLPPSGLPRDSRWLLDLQPLCQHPMQQRGERENVRAAASFPAGCPLFNNLSGARPHGSASISSRGHEVELQPPGGMGARAHPGGLAPVVAELGSAGVSLDGNYLAC